MIKPRLRKLLAFSLLVVSLALIFVGVTRSYKVLEPEDSVRLRGGNSPWGEVAGWEPKSEILDESQMIVQATFAGVIREGNELRLRPGGKDGKRACPT